MQIFVKTLKGSHFEIEVKPDDTVADVKKNIEASQGQSVYPADQQMLIHQGKVLKDETTLAENNVAEKAFIVIMLRKGELCTVVKFTIDKVRVHQAGLQQPLPHHQARLEHNVFYIGPIHLLYVLPVQERDYGRDDSKEDGGVGRGSEANQTGIEERFSTMENQMESRLGGIEEMIKKLMEMRSQAPLTVPITNPHHDLIGGPVAELKVKRDQKGRVR
ncbi:hypothetical protein M5K25_012410 [Dendrobium thyrsiflorum]|uniref:Ubiquitin-like domain-containing protein n=1 Tax=Dendrobium thyrsiflorum TaxID=117978 RepID=A0ABD0UXI4_DENTH